MQTICDFLALGGAQIIQLVLELLVPLFGQKIVRHAYISCYKNFASLLEMQMKGEPYNRGNGFSPESALNISRFHSPYKRRRTPLMQMQQTNSFALSPKGLNGRLRLFRGVERLSQHRELRFVFQGRLLPGA